MYDLVMKIVTATKTPHEWKRSGSGWKCAVCGTKAVEYDDFGNPEPYASVVYSSGGVTLELVETTCAEMAVFQVMDD